MSVIFNILSPNAFNERTADSRPGPGPFTKTSRFFIPNSSATVPQRSAATCAANGVLLRDPRNPDPPDVAQHKAFPCRSVIVIIVLLNDALICAIPSVTVRLIFFRVRGALALAIVVDTFIYFLIGRRWPFRVRALFLVRWPRKGKPRR